MTQPKPYPPRLDIWLGRTQDCEFEAYLAEYETSDEIAWDKSKPYLSREEHDAIVAELEQQRDEAMKCAESWMRDYDKLKEKYEPQLLIPSSALRDEEELERKLKIAEGALEELRLGHKHAPDLEHTRALGDGYGWCDFCNTKVLWGDGIADEALKEIRGEK